MLTHSPKISYITRRDIFAKLVLLRVMKKYDKSAAMQISQVFGTV